MGPFLFLPYFRSVPFEKTKIRVVIYLLVLLECIRILQIGWAYYYSNGQSMALDQWTIMILALAALAATAAGYKRSIAAVLSCILVYKLDKAFYSSSISTALFSFLCLFIAGYAKWIEKSTKDDDAITETRLELLYFLLWLSYSFINFLSAWQHIADPYWQNGSAMELFFTNPYYGTFAGFFQNFQHTNPILSGYLFKCISWSVLLSQWLLLPLYLFSLGRKLLVVWSLLLLICISVFLKISLLPHFSFLLFVLVFYRRGKSKFQRKNILPKNISMPSLKRYTWAIYVICALGFALHTPGISKITDQFFWSAKEWDTKLWLAKKMAIFGYHKPDVFNTNHAEGGQKWYVIYRYQDGMPQMVRFFDTQGNRLSYSGWDPLWLNNHGSDYLYFGNTVQYVLGNDTVTYELSETPYRFNGNSVTRLIAFDYYRQHFKTHEMYKVCFYARKSKISGGMVSWNPEVKLTNVVYFNIDRNRPELRFPVPELIRR